MNELEYKLAVKAGATEAIKEVAFSSAMLTPTGNLVMNDGGYSILNILQGYFPEEYDFTVEKLKREREEAHKEMMERLNKTFGGKEDGKKEL
jgi:hypothetical protein